MSELKRCPFCGGEAELACRDFGSWFVRCKKCFCKTPIFLTERFATISWNTRKPMKRIVERLEEEYHEIDKSKKESYENGDWERFDMFTNLNRGIYKSIEIVKEEGGLNERI